MGDTPDTAQRLAFARARIMFGSTVDPVEARFLFDRIDTLTAELAEVEAERDALRTLMRHVLEYVKDDPWLTPNFREEIRRAAEGGQ
jgi:hypothetical protein